LDRPRQKKKLRGSKCGGQGKIFGPARQEAMGGTNKVSKTKTKGEKKKRMGLIIQTRLRKKRLGKEVNTIEKGGKGW